MSEASASTQEQARSPRACSLFRVDSVGMAVANKGANERTVNDGGYETRVTATVGTGEETMRMAGQNTGGYETRVTQETGTH